MKIFIRFIALVIVLNIVRYVVGGPLEFPLVINRIFGVMERNAACFNIQFSSMDWVTSRSRLRGERPALFLRSRNACLLRPGPLTNHLRIFGGDLCLGVEQQVGTQGHLPAGNLSANLFELLGCPERWSMAVGVVPI